jgi:geranylgeranyl pyrophosphate synthase
MINLSFGQATDIYWHKGKAKEINEEQYLQMCAFKTGCLSRMAAKLAVVLSGGSEKLAEKIGRVAEAVGIAFQIQDDILNLTGEEFAKRKGGLGEDITEGKRSLMVIYTLKKANKKDRKRLIEILNLHPKNQKIRDEAIGIIKKYGSIEYVKERAKNLIEEAWQDAEKLLPESLAKKRLNEFINYLIERKI